jgi:hypothetical protein
VAWRRRGDDADEETPNAFEPRVPENTRDVFAFHATGALTYDF